MSWGSRASRARGQGNACGVAWEWAGPRQRSGLGPAAWDRFGFVRGIQPGGVLRCFSVGPPGRFLSRLPALPCCASRHLPTAPSAPPCPSVWGRWCGAVGRPGWSWQPGRGGLAGMKMPGAWQGSGRSPRRESGHGPAAWGRFGFFGGWSPCCGSRHIPAAPLALPCTSARGDSAGGGVRGVFGAAARGFVGMETPAALQGSGRSRRQGSGRGPAAWDKFDILRGIQPGCALRRFSIGRPGRFRPRFPAVSHRTS